MGLGKLSLVRPMLPTAMAAEECPRATVKISLVPDRGFEPSIQFSDVDVFEVRLVGRSVVGFKTY